MNIIRYNKARAGRYMGADDDFIGPPAPAAKNDNLSAVFGGLSSIAKSVTDSIVAGQLSINKSGIQYTGVPSTIPAVQQQTVTAAKTDYSKYLLVGIPVAAILFLSLSKR
jgi:hypothetical protein